VLRILATEAAAAQFPGSANEPLLAGMYGGKYSFFIRLMSALVITL
jgi:hypothetical protein